ncbi:MAG TPA: hypothetical protein VM182_13570 [Terriglobia bacterium]|nr:hypothetical protein [Terriglobia bacterium]
MGFVTKRAKQATSDDPPGDFEMKLAEVSQKRPGEQEAEHKKFPEVSCLSDHQIDQQKSLRADRKFQEIDPVFERNPSLGRTEGFPRQNKNQTYPHNDFSPGDEAVDFVHPLARSSGRAFSKTAYHRRLEGPAARTRNLRNAEWM